MSSSVFISHTTQDDAFVAKLGSALRDHGLSVWTDSRSMVPGDALKPDIIKAIRDASAFILVLSTDAFNSSWVFDETTIAKEMKTKKGDEFRIIPLLLGNIKPAAVTPYLGEELLGVQMKEGINGIDEGMHSLLEALGKRLPGDEKFMEEPEKPPVDELVLELFFPRLIEHNGVTRASATARLVFDPGGPDLRKAESDPFEFVSPLGPLEMDDIRWYLEKYSLWPTGVFKTRAKEIESKLPEFGKMLYTNAMNHKTALNILDAWNSPERETERRFTIHVNRKIKDDRTEKEKNEANEAASLLLSLPWELMHHRGVYLFQEDKPVQVRRRLPSETSFKIRKTDPPLRILLVSPRPDDERAGFIDHRVSARPLVQALESLGNLATLTMLTPPTFPALDQELIRAKERGEPYHVVHFDGHGVYNPKTGLGALCFEDPKDSHKLGKRACTIIEANELGGLIHKHQTPLFFLEACESAKTDKDPTSSVAASLLNHGVASVIAMTHSVLVETAKRFVESFYTSLVKGDRVGSAMVKARNALKADKYRFKIFGETDLYLEDWFVPVLYQEGEDPCLFKGIPTETLKEINLQVVQHKMGDLPPSPVHTFAGRIRELLSMERLLDQQEYGVLQGQSGEGKTTLGVEFARWCVKSRRYTRAVFVSLEDNRDLKAIINSMGMQLVPGYTVSTYSDHDLLTKALLPIERALREESCLILMDNMETLLEPVLEGMVEPEVIEAVLKLCNKLISTGKTRILFTSREALPSPFNNPGNTIRIQAMGTRDGIELVRNVMANQQLTPFDREKEGEPKLEALVQTVNCHARTLVLLAPHIASIGIEKTEKEMAGIMAAMDEKFPGSREQSLFASVELSLKRMSIEREKIGPLCLFR